MNIFLDLMYKVYVDLHPIWLILFLRKPNVLILTIYLWPVVQFRLKVYLLLKNPIHTEFMTYSVWMWFFATQQVDFNFKLVRKTEEKTN